MILSARYQSAIIGAGGRADGRAGGRAGRGRADRKGSANRPDGPTVPTVQPSNRPGSYGSIRRFQVQVVVIPFSVREYLPVRVVPSEDFMPLSG